MGQRVNCVRRMYDTVEIPLLPGAPFTSRIRSIKIAVENVRDPLTSEIPFKPNMYYDQVVDLRVVADIDAMLHLNARKTGTHKIQLIEAGKKCYGEIAETLSQVVDEHPELQAVGRIDACVDIADGPEVKWVVQSIRAKWSQWQAQHGTVRLEDAVGKQVNWSDMGKREVKTMYLGKRPNCFRVYDKLNERFRAWLLEKLRHERAVSRIVLQKALEAAPADNGVKAAVQADGKQTRDFYAKQLVCSGRYYAPFPEFEPWFRQQCSGPMQPFAEKMPKVLTRVERQMAAGRIPQTLNTLEKLFSKEALDFNPFDRFDFSRFESSTEIDLDNYSPMEFAAGMMFKQWLQDGMSYQHLYSFWDRKRNAKRMAVKFAPFIAAADSLQSSKLTPRELFEQYQNSLSRQMAA